MNGESLRRSLAIFSRRAPARRRASNPRLDEVTAQCFIPYWARRPPARNKSRI